MKRIHTLFLVPALLLSACQVDYHPYDTRISGETGINAKNIERIETACSGKQSIRFAVISDTQRWYDETRDVVKALNQRTDIDFVIHTGDMADFGMKSEFERMRDILNRLSVPYVAIIGNHDCLATGERVFIRIFGVCNYGFTAGNVRFICLNTNSLEYRKDEAVPDLEFLRDQIEHFPAEATKTIVAMHAQPYSEQFDNQVVELFQATIRQFPALQFCVHGHGHKFNVEDIFDDGVIYYECGNIQKRGYLLFTVNEEGYQYEKVSF